MFASSMTIALLVLPTEYLVSTSTCLCYRTTSLSQSARVGGRVIPQRSRDTRCDPSDTGIRV